MRFVKILAVNILALFFLLFIFEWVLEKVNPYERHHSVLSRHIQLREVALPNTVFYERPHRIFEKYTERLEIKDYRIETDSLGFIISNNYLPAAKMNIVFIGGSTTACRYVDDSLRFPSLVGDKFRAAGYAVNVFNAGVERSHSGHSLNILFNKILHRNFDVAVMMHGINDLVHLSYNGSYTSEENIQSRKALTTLARPDFDEPDLYFFRKHNFGKRMEKSFQVLFPRLHYELLSTKVKVIDGQDNLEFGWEKMQAVGEKQNVEFKGNIKSFVAICRANNIRPILMTQFNRISEKEFLENPIFSPYRKRLEASATSVKAFCESYKKMNEIVRQVAAAEGVLLVDLDAAVPKTADFMYDMVHLHGEGSRYVSELVFEELRQFTTPTE